MTFRQWVGGNGGGTGDLSIAANWDPAAVPVSNDDVEIGPRTTMYAINAGLTALTSVNLNSLKVSQGFTQNIGTDTAFMEVGVAGVSPTRCIFEGSGALCRVNLKATAIDVDVYATGNQGAGKPALQLTGTALTDVNIYSGSVAIGWEIDDTTIRVERVNIGHIDDGRPEPIVWLGYGVQAASGDPDISIKAGKAIFQCDVDQVDQQGGITIQEVGKWATFNLNSGTHHPDSNSASYGALKVWNGQLRNTRDTRTKTFASASLYGGYTYDDQLHKITVTAEIQWPDGIDAGQLLVGPDVKADINDI